MFWLVPQPLGCLQLESTCSCHKGNEACTERSVGNGHGLHAGAERRWTLHIHLPEPGDVPFPHTFLDAQPHSGMTVGPPVFGKAAQLLQTDLPSQSNYLRGKQSM